MHKHTFIPSGEVEDYEVCTQCQTLHHLNPAKPEDVYQDEYWSDKHSHSSIYEQCFNLDSHIENGLTKNQFILDHIPVYSEKLLEIGCAPGATINAILRSDMADEIVGIDVDKSYAKEIEEIATRVCGEVTLKFGFFPEAADDYVDGYFNCIIGVDVFEHSFTPELFLKKCFLLLNNNGCLFLMLPLVQDDGSILDRMRHREHVHLFSKSCLKEMLEEIGFKDVTFDQWCGGHDTVTCYKP